MSAPFISVLVPVYNREGLLPACLESACAQTVRDLEVIVVDNASTDATWDICRRFAERDPRIRIFRNETNIGPVRNWRRCFREARGLYGKVLFSDDLISPTFLERTIPYLDDSETGFVFTMAEIGADPERAKPSYRWRDRPGKFASAEFLHDAMYAGDVPVSPGAALFRLADLRDSLVEFIPSNLPGDFAAHGAGPDLLLYLLTAARYLAVAHIPEPLTFFRWHPGSISYMENARLQDCYTQARIWFASNFDRGSLLSEAISAAWFSRMKSQRRWIWPDEIRRKFLDAPVCDSAHFFSSLAFLLRRKLTSL